MKEVVLTIIFGFSIKFCTHSCTKFESAKIFSEGFFLLAVCTVRQGDSFAAHYQKNG